MKNQQEEESNKQESKKASVFFIFLTGVCFVVSISIVFIHSYFPTSIKIAGIELKKLNKISDEQLNEQITEVNTINNSSKEQIKDTVNLSNSASLIIDSINQVKPANDSFVVVHQSNIVYKDSVKHRVMIMGDSECGGLCYQLNKYCIQNNHELVATLVWNSATILNFGYSDTINKLIKKYQPSYLFFVVGLNELHAKDLTKRKEASINMLAKIKHIPYTWIGPANYIDDKGINNVFQSTADSGSFFLTKGINLPKGTDGRHPSSIGYQLWMDSIANWMNIKAKYKIAMARPTKKSYPFKSKMMVLNAAKYRGY
jgi:hypothetical protein